MLLRAAPSGLSLDRQSSKRYMEMCLKDTVGVGTVGEHGLAHLPPCLSVQVNCSTRWPGCKACMYQSSGRDRCQILTDIIL